MVCSHPTVLAENDNLIYVVLSFQFHCIVSNNTVYIANKVSGIKTCTFIQYVVRNL